MQAINLLVKEVQYLENIGLLEDAMLLQAIDTNCAKLYKYVQIHLTHTNTNSHDSRVIDLPTLKS